MSWVLCWTIPRRDSWNWKYDFFFEVFFVDYGNCSTATLNEIRIWDEKFDNYPFQAVECKLDNVKKVREGHKDAVAYFESLVLQKVVKAYVT